MDGYTIAHTFFWIFFGRRKLVWLSKVLSWTGRCWDPFQERLGLLLCAQWFLGIVGFDRDTTAMKNRPQTSKHNGVEGGTQIVSCAESRNNLERCTK